MNDQPLQNLKLIFIVCLGILFSNVLNVNAQEPQLATFLESSSVIIDQIKNQEIIASVTLQTTNIQEIRVPDELDRKIRNTEKVLAVIITNEEPCVLGAQDETCVMINISMEGIEGGINTIQDTAREIGDSLIDDINEAFLLDAKPHSAYIHADDTVNRALETSGIISGHGTVSAVYTMPKEDTFAFYEKMSAILLPKIIRESGGFFEVGKKISAEQNSTVTFSIIPQDPFSIMQLKVSTKYPLIEETISSLQPLDYLQTEKLERSEYFLRGHYPLNSLFQFVILSQEPLKIDTIQTNMLPITEIEGEKFPTDFVNSGWFFDSDSGNKLEGKYLFGKETFVTKNDLAITFTSFNPELADNDINIVSDKQDDTSSDESIFILIGIGIAAAAAIAFYLKGFRK